MNSSEGLTAIVWTSEEECENGHLKIGENGISIKLESGRVLSSQKPSNSLYRLIDGPFMMANRVFFDPILFVIRPYAGDVGHVVEDVFPPSSGGFYGRMKLGGKKAVYVVQQIEGDSKLWLLIGDPKTGGVFESQMIHAYEAEAIKLLENKDFQNLLDWSMLENDLEKDRIDVLEVLDEPSPSWEDIAKLVSDVTIDNLKLGVSMRDTLSQFVPDSFPDSIREELMAFLAFANRPEILMEDPVDFSWRTYSFQSFGNLIRGHLRCILSDNPWPPYIKYLRLAEKKRLQRPIVTLDANIESPWDIFRQKVNEAFPNWTGIAINSAKDLTKSGKVITKMPATRSRAKKSKRVWKERLAAVSYGLRIRGHINSGTIGLTDLVYLGAAYRWPHRHMKFITKLGSSESNPPHIHVMTMPKTAAERVKRFLPNVMEVAWSARTANLDLYDHTSESWYVSVSRIVESIDRESSRRRLVKRFTRSSQRDTYQLNFDEAKVAGLVSKDIFLVDFEKPGRFNYWGLSGNRIHSILANLYQRGIVDITYGVSDAQLVSIATVAQGKSKYITSLTESFLDYSATSLAMLNKSSDMVVILSMLPEEAAYELVAELPRYGILKDVMIRCMRPTAFRSFTFDLYHRLLKDDGTWDDDVTAFLSQARSKRKELSESNA